MYTLVSKFTLKVIIVKFLSVALTGTEVGTVSKVKAKL